MNQHEFERAVQAAGLIPRICHETHWQITGGDKLVDCWPNMKHGFKHRVDGVTYRNSTLAHAITRAGKPQHTENPPPWESDKRFPTRYPDVPLHRQDANEFRSGCYIGVILASVVWGLVLAVILAR